MRSRSSVAAAAADNADADELCAERCNGLARVKLEGVACDGDGTRCAAGGIFENCTLGLVLLNAELVIGVDGCECDDGADIVVGVRLPSGGMLEAELIGGPPINDSGAPDTGGINGGPK